MCNDTKVETQSCRLEDNKIDTSYTNSMFVASFISNGAKNRLKIHQQALREYNLARDIHV